MLVFVLVMVWLGGFKAFMSVELSQLIVSPGASQGVLCFFEA
jgi:hypothetical protein